MALTHAVPSLWTADSRAVAMSLKIAGETIHLSKRSATASGVAST